MSMIKLNRIQAEKYLNANSDNSIIICPSKCSPHSISAVTLTSRDLDICQKDLKSYTSYFTFANGNYELGYTAHYYIYPQVK